MYFIFFLGENIYYEVFEKLVIELIDWCINEDHLKEMLYLSPIACFDILFMLFRGSNDILPIINQLWKFPES